MSSTLLTLGRLAAAFIAGLLVCSGALQWLGTDLDRGTVRNKLAHFAQQSSEYDTLFLGSSRTYRQIIPEVFDEATAKFGARTSTFNFGVDGMFAPEDGFVAEQIFALKPKLRWVFIEVSHFQAAHAEQNAGSVRAVYWHDLRRTWLVCRELLGELKPFRWKSRGKRLKELRESVDRCLLHLQTFSSRQFQLGRGAAVLDAFRETKTSESVIGASLGGRRDGFVPIERPNGMTESDLAEYDQQFQRLITRGPRRQPLSEPAQENLERILSIVRANGAEAALYIAPTTAPITFVPRRDVGVPLLDFSRADQWPVFFEEKYRVDIAHLNAAGGEILTRFLAQRWLAYQLEGKEPTTSGELDAWLGHAASSLDVRNSTP